MSTKSIAVEDLIAVLAAEIQIRKELIHTGVADSDEVAGAEIDLAILVGALAITTQIQHGLVEVSDATSKVQVYRDALNLIWPTVKDVFEDAGREIPLEDEPEVTGSDPGDDTEDGGNVKLN